MLDFKLGIHVDIMDVIFKRSNIDNYIFLS
jgi:hypothetical protein